MLRSSRQPSPLYRAINSQRFPALYKIIALPVAYVPSTMGQAWNLICPHPTPQALTDSDVPVQEGEHNNLLQHLFLANLSACLTQNLQPAAVTKKTNTPLTLWPSSAWRYTESGI